MRTGRGCLLILATLIFSLCQAGLIEYAQEIPGCGLSCVIEAIPASVCHTFTNDTCICTDPDLLVAVTECATRKCSVLDQIKFAKIQETACEKPQRRRSMVDEVIFFVLDAVTLLCIVVRIFVRYHMTHTMEMDDWVVVLAVLVWGPFLGLGHYIRIVALGRDIWDLDPEAVTSVLRVTFIDELLYTLVLSLCRIAVVMFLLRVFDVPRFRVIAWAVIGWIVLYAIAIITATIFQCVPLDYNWLGWTGQYSGSHKCIDVNALSFAAAGVGIAQDVAIMLLPLPIILNLNMAFRKRVQTVVMFSLGIIVVITSAVRLRYLVRFETSNNPTWDNVDAIIWTHIEVSVSVIVVCLPSIRAALVSVAPHLFGSTAKTPDNSFGGKGGAPFSGPGGSSNLSRRSRARREQYEGLDDDVAGGAADIELATSPRGPMGRRDIIGDEEEDDHHKGIGIRHYHSNESSDVILGNNHTVVESGGEKEDIKPAFRNFSHPPGPRSGQGGTTRFKRDAAI
ncbi:Satratoxin biosynthesis SC1 cluster protein 4 [Apiospora arundinis]|uniref:Satratoxin biosynthesis SC1 cluster protein 4 n=1 Tax=Apiospora arundinis TaxID=335852 RepID=A0ABR2IAS5_9PEZI